MGNELGFNRHTFRWGPLHRPWPRSRNSPKEGVLEDSGEGGLAGQRQGSMGGSEQTPSMSITELSRSVTPSTCPSTRGMRDLVLSLRVQDPTNHTGRASRCRPGSAPGAASSPALSPLATPQVTLPGPGASFCGTGGPEPLSESSDSWWGPAVLCRSLGFSVSRNVFFSCS